MLAEGILLPFVAPNIDAIEVICRCRSELGLHLDCQGAQTPVAVVADVPAKRGLHPAGNAMMAPEIALLTIYVEVDRGSSPGKGTENGESCGSGWQTQ